MRRTTVILSYPKQFLLKGFFGGLEMKQGVSNEAGARSEAVTITKQGVSFVASQCWNEKSELVKEEDSWTVWPLDLARVRLGAKI